MDRSEKHDLVFVSPANIHGAVLGVRAYCTCEAIHPMVDKGMPEVAGIVLDPHLPEIQCLVRRARSICRDRLECTAAIGVSVDNPMEGLWSRARRDPALPHHKVSCPVDVPFHQTL